MRGVWLLSENHAVAFVDETTFVQKQAIYLAFIYNNRWHLSKEYHAGTKSTDSATFYSVKMSSRFSHPSSP